MTEDLDTLRRQFLEAMPGLSVFKQLLATCEELSQKPDATQLAALTAELTTVKDRLGKAQDRLTELTDLRERARALLTDIFQTTTDPVTKQKIRDFQNPSPGNN